MAAALLDGGRTWHSIFNIPIPCDYSSTCNVSVSSELGRNLREVDLILWDEAVMAHKRCLEAFNRMMKDINSS